MEFTKEHNLCLKVVKFHISLPIMDFWFVGYCGCSFRHGSEIDFFHWWFIFTNFAWTWIVFIFANITYIWFAAQREKERINYLIRQKFVREKLQVFLHFITFFRYNFFLTKILPGKIFTKKNTFCEDALTCVENLWECHSIRCSSLQNIRMISPVI